VERRKVQVVVLDMEDVPALDATGLVALESLVADLNGAAIKVVLVGVQPQPLRAFVRAGWKDRKGRLRIFQSVEPGLEVARRTVEESAPEAGQTGSSGPPSS
jgi:SulP family sulfate permease